ncbi:MAG: nitroreductase family protein [Bacillota bacterium]
MEIIKETSREPAATGDWNEVERLILRRRSVRLYQKKQVPGELIKRILEAGRFAPSAGNCQPWKFVVVRDRKIIDGLTEDVVGKCRLFKSLIDYRSGRLRFLKKITAKLLTKLMPNDLHPMPFSFISLIADGKLGLYHGAPTIILIFKDVRGVSNPDLDCGIAGQNMVLAAHSLGLGTCWVSFTKLAFKSSKWYKYFNISFPYKFASSLCIGYPVGDPDGFISRDTHPVDWYEDGTGITIN